MGKTLEKKQEADLVKNNVDQMFGGADYRIPVDAPLPQIKILRETPMFETPAEETVKSITGHLIYWHNANQYYSSEYGAEGEAAPPTCTSSDGLTPDGGEDPLAGPCRDCELNAYGSATDGRGKACKNTIRLYILVDGEVIPCVLVAPPSSLGKKGSLMKWLTNAPNIAAKAGVGKAYQPIKIKLTLHKKEFDSGFSASVLDVSTKAVLTPDGDMDELKKLSNLFQEFTKNYLGRIVDDVASEEDGRQQEDIPI